MKYTVVIEPGTETTAWGVEVPDLPGCFSAGDTLEEAMENAKEAICLWVETMLEKGAKIPPLEKNAADLGSLTIYLIHGDADITVPIPSSNRLYEACCTALGEDSIQYRVVPGMGHASDPLYSDEVLAEIDEYLQKRLP